MEAVKEQTVIVDGQAVSLQVLEEMRRNTKKQLREVSPGVYKSFDLMHG